MNQRVRKKIALELDATLSISNHDYSNATYWTNGVRKSFLEMFGEEK